MIVDGFVSLLRADPNTNACISGRAYNTNLPRGHVFPALVVHRYGGNRDNDMSGPVGVREDQIQVDVYGDNPTQCDALAEMVLSAVVSFTGTLPDGTIVQLIQHERFMDMNFLSNANKTAIAKRAILGFKVYSTVGA